LTPTSYARLFGRPHDQNTFVLFSDTHIAADSLLDHGGVNMADNLAACVRDLGKWPVMPAAVFINGDLAFKSGLPGDYSTFGKLIESVRAMSPIYLSVGNHDDRENFWVAFPDDAKRLKAVPQKQAALVTGYHANWFLLDSLDITDSAPGEVGAAQYTWLSSALERHQEKAAIIVCHHNMQSPGSTTGLKDTPAMNELFARHRHVKAFVFGHTHNWHVEEHPSGVHLVNLPPTSYPFSPGRPSGWVRCKLTRAGAEFELLALDPNNPEHGQMTKLQWRKA